MLDLVITFNDGESFRSNGWYDRPMQVLLLAVHRAFEDVKEITIVRFKPA